MISNTDKAYQDQINASNDWEKKQTELQNQQTDFAIQQIEQQKADAQKDYTKEQSGAYVDWKTQSKEHGVRAEQMADKGMQNTGYSESMQVSMYNTYQNRVAVARESINRIFADYNNKITEARLQNNATLAEIAFKAQQQRLELVLQQLTAKNQLLLQKANQKLEIENSYYNRYQDVLKQINTENALAEQVRQYNESMALEREQFEWQKKKASSYSGGGGGGNYRRSSGGGDVYEPNKTNSTSETEWNETERDSILKSGVGPVSMYGLAVAESQGKVHTYTDSKGNVHVSKVPVSAAATGAKPMTTASSNKSSGSSLVSKVTNWVKKIFN
jgi:hypothetical protein